MVVDAGAQAKLTQEGKSLLPVGVKAVQGEFLRGDVVAVQTEAGEVLGRGLSNYGSGEARQIAGLPSSQIAQRLGYCAEPELIHRDNWVSLG